MKKFLLFLCFSLFITSQSQVININSYVKSDGSDAFKKALDAIKKEYSAKKKHVVLYIPAGTYTLKEPIILNKYISLEGESGASTILQVTNPNQEGIILEENKNESDIYNAYNSIKNLTITGPDFGKNSSEWKDLKRNNPKSVGIKVLGLRNRIENCTIDGFLWSGILISSSYYNYLTNNFIKNNRIGITIDNNSTSAFISNNEIRNNSSGILIQNNSYANFINNNLIENNITNMLSELKNDDDQTVLSKGNGIILNQAMNNFIQNNYFEQQYTNISLINANDNEISSNFFALGNVNNRSQNIFKLNGKSERNKIEQNQTMGSTTAIDATKIYISKDGNYSSNIVDFGKEKNDQIKNKIRNSRNEKQIPQIR